MPREITVPLMRKRSLPQGLRAYVTLTDANSGGRRDFNLGQWGAAASREAYLKLLVEWEKNGRRLPEKRRTAKAVDRPAGLTVTQLADMYLTNLPLRYSAGYRATIRAALLRLVDVCGSEPAAGFGPNALRTARDAMVRAGVSEHTANEYGRQIVRVYKWAAAHELLPVTIYDAIRVLEPLPDRDRQPVRPAPEAAIAAAMKHVSRQVAAMIGLQLMTGARPGEVCVIRPADIDMSGKVWRYQPSQHKTSWRGRSHVVYLGPRAQEIVRPFLDRATTAYLFSPTEAEADRRAELSSRRRTPLSYGNRPGTNRREQPGRAAGDRYTAASYRRAIERACVAAGVDRWHPHQLRHAAATNIRREFGLEAAALMLGHSSALLTDAVYAERDMAKAMEIAGKIG